MYNKSMENVNLLPENEYKVVEDRRYINPTLPVTETEDFITNFRDTQRGNTQEISTQTQMLGTDVPSNLGGLTGSSSYWTSRYQTPQTNAVTQNLRTAAQATALNEALANEEAMWKKKYNDAYKKYQKRQYDASKKGSGGSPKNPTNPSGNGEVEQKGSTSYTIDGVTPGAPGGYTISTIDTENNTVTGQTYVPYGKEGEVNYHNTAPGVYGYTKFMGDIYKDNNGDYYRRTDNGYEFLGRPQ